MKLTFNIGFEELLQLADQLPLRQKERLIRFLQKSVRKNNEKAKKIEERQLGKYEGQIRMAEDFNAPLDDFKEYMK